MTTSTDYSISYPAIVVLSHLREKFHLTDHQAKDFYNIDDLSTPVKELLAAGHLIHETFLPISEQIGTTPIRAYTLGNFLQGLPDLAKLLLAFDLKLYGGVDNKEAEEVKKIMHTILERSFFLIKIDLLHRLGMKSRLTSVLQRNYDNRLAHLPIKSAMTIDDSHLNNKVVRGHYEQYQ